MMKISIRRNGIVLRTIDVKGEQARIGNAPDNDIVVDDSYLSPHVADLILKDGAWRVVDAGRLEGIKMAGRRVDDEPLVAGTVYSIGGFELIAHFDQTVPPASRERNLSGGYDIPGTVIAEFEDLPGRSRPAAEEGFLPRTGVGRLAPEPAKPMFASGFEVMPAAGPTPVSGNQRPRRRLLIVSGILGVAILLLLVVGLARRSGRPAKAPVAATATIATAAPPPLQPDAAEELRAGEEALAALDYDRGLAHWETALTLAPNEKLQQRYADVAVDVGRAYLARGESAKATVYLQKAIARGPAGAESVSIARRSLGHGAVSR
jgi:hypothetical protein